MDTLYSLEGRLGLAEAWRAWMSIGALPCILLLSYCLHTNINEISHNLQYIMANKELHLHGSSVQTVNMTKLPGEWIHTIQSRMFCVYDCESNSMQCKITLGKVILTQEHPVLQTFSCHYFQNAWHVATAVLVPLLKSSTSCGSCFSYMKHILCKNSRPHYGIANVKVTDKSV